MTLFSAAAAAALDAPPDASDTSLYRYRTRIEFPVKKSLSNAPNLLQKLLATLVGTIPGILFYNAADEKIDVEDFPRDKTQFDHIFKTIVTEERNQRLVISFEIRSDQHFHAIKKSVWTFLTQHGIFMKKHTGTLQKMDLVTLGHLHKAHPTFSSPTCLREEIMTGIYGKLGALKSEDLTALNIPNDGRHPDVFVSPGKIKGNYQNEAISSNVVYLQAERCDVELLRTCVENFFEDHHMVFVPSTLKHENPDLFGAYLCHQNEFLENNRNIAIVGLSTEAMDHEENPASSMDEELPHETATALWVVLQNLPGVQRINSCRRTFDLGKWNLTTTKEHYPTVTAWIDENLSGLFSQLPADIQAQSIFTEFPVPRRLTRHSRTSTRSISNGTVSSYNQSLATRLSTSSKVSVVQRSAWRPHQPVVDISYAFDYQEFPPMATKQDTDTKSTASLSHFSNSLSEQALKDAINSETEKLRVESTQRDDDMDTRIKSLEDKLTSLTAAIVGEIFRKMTGEGSPFVTKTILDEKLDQQFALIEKLSRQIDKIATAVSTPPTGTIKSPPRKQARCTSPETPVASPDKAMREPPDQLE